VAFAQWDDQLLKPFVMNHRAATASPADLSFLSDGPAGQDGFIRVRGGHLVKPDGKRIRFWGVHFTDWSRGSVEIPPKEDMPMWAATLARFGANIVRLHFLDLAAPRGIISSTGNDSRSFDAQQLDRLDFEISEFKKRGIYADLNLNVGRSYKAGDGAQDFDKITWGKGLTLFDPRLIELEKEYAKQLLTHVNPYTKTEYRNEPAIAIVEILNENGLGIGFRAPTPYYDNELTGQYNAWLKNKLTPEQLTKLRAAAGVAGDGPVPRLKTAELASAPKERYDPEVSFYDGHIYWEHPGAPPPANTPMVNDPLHSTVVQLSRTAFSGKPYTISETNHPFPNQWASEGVPIIASYGDFQDWDMIITYTFEPKLAPDWKSYVGDPFDISLDPVQMTEFAAGALIFRRADVEPARKIIERTYSRDQVLESKRLPGAGQPYFTPGFPLSIPLQHGVRIKSLDGQPTEKYTADDSNPIVSDTKELAWYTTPEKTGLVTVETDRTQTHRSGRVAYPDRAGHRDGCPAEPSRRGRPAGRPNESPFGGHRNVRRFQPGRGRPNGDPAGLGAGLYDRQAHPAVCFPAVRFVVVVALHVAVVCADELAFALNLEGHLMGGIRHHPALGVHDPDGDVGDILAVGGDGIPVHLQIDSRRFAGGADLHRDDVFPLSSADDLESPRLVGNGPGEVQIRRGPRAPG
jgi:hypothetical protein